VGKDGDKSTTDRLVRELAQLRERSAAAGRAVTPEVTAWLRELLRQPAIALARAAMDSGQPAMITVPLVAESEATVLLREIRAEIAQAAAAKPTPPKQRRVVEGLQAPRIHIKLMKLFPNGIPSEQALSNTELVATVVKEFKNDPRKTETGLGIPHRKTILRAAGRIPRKK
jgi:hypothetical protein